MEQKTKQLCSITIIFPTDTDETAIDIKKKIVNVVAEIQEARIQFSLVNVPAVRPTNGTQIQ